MDHSVAVEDFVDAGQNAGPSTADLLKLDHAGALDGLHEFRENMYELRGVLFRGIERRLDAGFHRSIVSVLKLLGSHVHLFDAGDLLVCVDGVIDHVLHGRLALHKSGDRLCARSSRVGNDALLDLHTVRVRIEVLAPVHKAEDAGDLPGGYGLAMSSRAFDSYGVDRFLSVQRIDIFVDNVKHVVRNDNVIIERGNEDLFGFGQERKIRLADLVVLGHCDFNRFDCSSLARLCRGPRQDGRGANDDLTVICL